LIRFILKKYIFQREMLVIILLQPTLVNRFCEVGRSRQRIMIPQKAMLEN